ncbi:MAG: tubulin-like doman-containing protein [Tetrasphaera sp.]
MRNILFVGCGGSGGALLGYLMDQLRSDLRRHGIENLPGGWGFVHVDCPPAPDEVAPGLGTVWDLGGKYIALAPQVGSYAIVDRAVTSGSAVGHIATWAPRRPDRVNVPIQLGAGQQRVLGRVLLASRAPSLIEQLKSVVDGMKSAESTSQMYAVARALGESYDASQASYTIVLSSMAGGTGASIALDVCRILGQIVDSSLMSVFMCSPDVFDSIPASLRAGVRPNALAMLGEIVASQLGESHEHDLALLAAVGAPVTGAAPVPFARVIPVGRFLGTAGTPFGDGNMQTIYRGVGQCLAALTVSEKALDNYRKFILENFTPRAHTRVSAFGWGAHNNPDIQWGSIGYASLSMGRDRYAEYSAQRMARAALDHLIGGHLQRGNPNSGQLQARALVTSQWPYVCSQLGLPAGGGQDPQALVRWVYDFGLPRQKSAQIARSVVERGLAAEMPVATAGMPAEQFMPTLMNFLAAKRARLAQLAKDAAYAEAYTWEGAFVARIERVIGEAIATHGLVYAKELVSVLQEHLSGNYGAAGLAALGAQTPDAEQIPPAVGELASSVRGVINRGQELADQVRERYHAMIDVSARGQWCVLAAQILGDISSGVLAPLGEAVMAALRDVETAQQTAATRTGLATVATYQYALWPADGEAIVDARWSAADNEVLLTPASAFPDQYLRDQAAACKSDGDEAPPAPAEARRRTIQAVVTGLWATAGGYSPPGGLITTDPPFVAKSLPIDPATGKPQIPTRAVYTVHVTATNVLDRARQYVNRTQSSFAIFVGESIRSYLDSGGGHRGDEVVGKFRQVLTKAVPFAQVSPQVVDEVHDGPATVNFFFSDIPFAGLPIAAELEALVTQDASVDALTTQNLTRALSQAPATRIDVFGYYPNELPVVYSGLLEPTRSQWAQSLSADARTTFWHGRRSRPLPAALALSNAERQAMIGGWFLGQITGEIEIPPPPYTQPVRVWDHQKNTWQPFPNPLLTPPERFLRNFDWLPAVLESHLLAVANFGASPVGQAMAPYESLRRLWDDNPDGPTQVAAGMFQLRAAGAIANWLTDGRTPPGPGSRVPGLEPTSTGEERRTAALEWLNSILSLVTEHFDSNGRGEFAQIHTADQREKVPYFRDLAPDLMVVLPRLIDTVTDAPIGAADPGTTALMNSTF